MKTKFLIPLAIVGATFVVGCSFQKNPNKDTPEPVKVGMTKHELEDEMLKMDSVSLADRINFAIKQNNKELALKLVSESDPEKLNGYSQDGRTALEVALRANQDEVVLLLLSKGASPYVPRKGTSFSALDLIKSRAVPSPDVDQMLQISDRKLSQRATSVARQDVRSIYLFYLETHFPFYKKMPDGQTSSIKWQRPLLIDCQMSNHAMSVSSS